MFNGFYDRKKVVVTGHTGFKGSWLCHWLVSMGAEVSGISNEIPTEPSLFEITGLASKIDHYICDVTAKVEFVALLEDLKPDIIFHLAAQPIVSTSYANPITTIETNALGTAVVCDFLKECDYPVLCILITSDKCYENVEWDFGYRESDILGGRDVYSASKACAEILYASYFHSFLQHKDNVRVCSARAGNVIGGGDWAKDRIVVDMIKAWSVGQPVQIRSPNATRPWQHVLEPLSGYLHLCERLSEDDSLNGQAFNFGPRAEQNRTVLELANDLFEKLQPLVSASNACEVIGNIPFHEAGLLKLCCDKALMRLKWEANLSYDNCVSLTGDWFGAYFSDGDMNQITVSQIQEYCALASAGDLIWTK